MILTRRTPLRTIRLPLLTALLVLLLSMVLVACGQPDPEIEAMTLGQSNDKPSGRILFVSEGNVHVWQNGDIKRLTGDGNAASPTWSPAGDRFAYIVVHDAYSDVLVARNTGETLVVVTDGHRPDLDEFSQEFVENAAWAMDVDWSPVGEQLIYVSDKGGYDMFSRPLYLWYSESFEIPPYQLNASVEIRATQESPVLSPDGDTVAFVVRNEYEAGVRVAEIWLLDLNSATYEQFIVSDDGAYAPEWSPDGKNLTFVQRIGEGNEIWIAPVDGSHPPYQITNVGSAAAPVWSPDGRFIAFFRVMDGEFEAWYVEVTEGEDGIYTASDPEKLFSASDIDAPSGMSWRPN